MDKLLIYESISCSRSSLISHNSLHNEKQKHTSNFGKEGENVDVILDSTVKRGLKIDYITIKGLTSIYPDVGRKIGVWRKGSAADILTRALITLNNIKSEIIYIDDM